MSKRTHDILLDYSALRQRGLGKNAITAAKLKRLSPKVSKIIRQINAERKDGGHAYRDLPHDRLLPRAVEAFARQARKRCDNLVVLGIGGSALGTSALQQALTHPYYNLVSKRKRGGPRLFVLDNVDPAQVQGLLDLLKDELSTTLFNVVTKSGQTAETASQFMIVRKLITRRLGAAQAAKNIVVTTDPRHGDMRSVVTKEGYASFPIPSGVGGRFSMLSAVGLFPAAMCGIDIKQLLRGAVAADTLTSSTQLNRNPAALFAAINYLCYNRGQRTVVMMPYSNALVGCADWFRQLWAESLGKAYDASGRKRVDIGPTPVIALGATDQHSQIQLYREGPDDKLIVMLEVSEHGGDVRIPEQFKTVPAFGYLAGNTLGELLTAECQATRQALAASKRPTMTIKFPTITARTVGQFVYTMEVATTILGYLFGVNPYDQPGVELGKKITYHLMRRPGFERMPKP